MTASTKANRRFFRFSLRAFLLAVLLVCAALGLKVKRASRQREVVSWVQEMGGSVSYDHEIGDDSLFFTDHSLNNVEPPVPEWLIELIGIDFFDNVVSVDLVNATQVSDVTPLAGLPNIEHLCLVSTQVADVTPLSGLTKLRTLHLSDTRVSDITPLTELTNLNRLFLGRTQVSDVTPLAELTNLRLLELAGTQVSDVSPLSDLTTLETLHLGRTLVSDVSPLTSLMSLKWLQLSDTGVSDLTPIPELTSLKTLILRRMSKEEIENLKRALPQCNIIH